jgi:hypothetical protein
MRFNMRKQRAAPSLGATASQTELEVKNDIFSADLTLTEK